MSLSARSFRHALLVTILFLFPTIYINQHNQTWTSRLTAASLRPSPRDAALLVKGLSLPVADHVPLVQGLSLQVPDSAAPSNPKPLAVCITGHLRSFPSQSVHTSIKQHLISPLVAAGYSVDVFFHISRDDVPKPGTTKATSRSVAAAMKLFSPVVVSFLSNNVTCGKPECALSSRHANVSCPFSLIRAEQCVRLVTRYEKRMGRKYEWIYKTRPDVAFGSHMSIPDVLREDTLYVNQHIPGTSTHAHAWLRRLFKENGTVVQDVVADQVMVAARPLADIVFRASLAFDECALYELPKGTLNTEVALTYWLAKNGVRYHALPWFWMLVRDGEGPECSRVQYIRNGTGQSNTTLMNRCKIYKQAGFIPE